MCEIVLNVIDPYHVDFDQTQKKSSQQLHSRKKSKDRFMNKVR